jgi:preprotein translocase subunit SecF
MAFKIGNIQVFPKNYFFDFMRWRKITVGISLVLVLTSILIIAIKGINYSIDFLGGSEIQVRFEKDSPSQEDLKNTLVQQGYHHVEVTTSGAISRTSVGTNYIIRLQREKGQDENQTTGKTAEMVGFLKQKYAGNQIEVLSTTNISGKVGKEDEYKGYMALLFACLGILAYIAVRFDSRFAPGAVLCLIHNVIIALGFMTALEKPFTTASIAAFLTIVGYTINDTVIVYDRIRETRLLSPTLPLVDVVNRSISQTMNRTVLTSTTGILALLVLSILGGGSIEDFALTMLVGIIVGTYSSIYVAAPLTLMGWTWKIPQVGNKSTEQKVQDTSPPIRIRKKDNKK